jgi:hypothetical protein
VDPEIAGHMGVNHGEDGGDESPQNLQWGYANTGCRPQIFVIFQNFKRSPWIRPPRFQPRSTPLAGQGVSFWLDFLWMFILDEDADECLI